MYTSRYNYVSVSIPTFLQEGHVLGEDERIENIWETGLHRYTDKMWSQTIDLMEEAVRLFNIYENQTILCLKECQTTGKNSTVYQLALCVYVIVHAYHHSECYCIAEPSASQQKTLKDYAGDDEPFVSQFLVYATRGKCLRDCKARTLPSHLQYLDPVLVQEFRRRKPFSYLHFAYYQVSRLSIASNRVNE